MCLLPPLRLVLAAILFAALLPADALAQSRAQTSAGFYDAQSRGWHFYEDPPPPVKAEPDPETPPVQGKAAPPPLSAEWLRKNMDLYRDRAIDNPTRENVAAFAALQRISMDKAERFAEMMAVVATDPALDEKARSPISALQLDAAQDVQRAARTRILSELGKRVGLWYFFRSDCPFCARQDPILERLAAQTGITILPISIDGAPLISGAFPNFVRDAGQGAKLGVAVTPTLVLADPSTGGLVKIAEGLKTSAELEDRILDLAHNQGWISQADYDEAMRGMPRRYLLDGVTPEQLAALESNPEALMQVLREASLIGGSTPLNATNSTGAAR